MYQKQHQRILLSFRTCKSKETLAQEVIFERFKAKINILLALLKTRY